MSQLLEFPPLLTGIAVPGDPLEAALASVANEVEPGAVFYAVNEATMRTALVLAPEQPLGEALAVSFAVTLGANDAIGVLAPPEVAVHLEWPDRIRVNGALCGRLTAHASTDDAKAEPDWLILALDIPVLPQTDEDPGLNPNETSLHNEGCGEIMVPDLIEVWARHLMNWLHIYLTDGFAPLHEEWRSKAHNLGNEITTPEAGTFLGLDEWGGLILKSDDQAQVIPLTRLLST